MKILNNIELSNKVDTNQPYISLKTKKANENNINHIIIKESKYYFRKKLVGKGYEFCEVPFNELLTDVKGSLNSSLNDIKKDVVVSDIDIAPTTTTLSTSRQNGVELVVNELQQRALIDSYPIEKQNEATLKVGVVQSWLKAKSERIKKDDFLTYINTKSELKNITNKKLKDWTRAFNQSGILGLIDKRGVTTGSSILSVEYKEFIIKHIEATQAGQINATEIYRNLHDYIFTKNNTPETMILFIGNYKKYQLFGVDTVRREIQRFKNNNPIKYHQLTRGYDRTKSLFDSAYGTMDNALYRCEEFQLDMTPANFMVIDDDGRVYRPKITTVVDTFSRRAIMIITETANSYTAVKALIKAIEKLGTPNKVRTDNGKDYISNHFKIYMSNLNIQHENTGVGSGRENAFVERLHQIQDKNLKYLDNYLGRNVAERTTQEHQTPKKDRLKGIAKKTHQLVELTIDKAMEMIDKVIELNDITYHKTLECTPVEKYNSDNTPITFTATEILIAFAGKTALRKYGKKGISINTIHFSIIELHNELVGRTVRYYENFKNTNEVFIFVDSEYKGTAFSEYSDQNSIKDFQKANREFDKELRANKKSFDNSKSFISESVTNNINTKYELAVNQGKYDRPKNEEVYIPDFTDELSKVAKQIKEDKQDIKQIENQIKQQGEVTIDWDAVAKQDEEEYKLKQQRKIG